MPKNNLPKSNLDRIKSLEKQSQREINTAFSDNVQYRVGVLELCYKEMDGKLEKIMTNELPHIKEKMIELNGNIESLKTRIAVLSMLNVGAIILGLLIGRIL